MTVIVAARCQDGAVIGADSQATEVAPQVRWQVDKLFPLGESIVWGASGQTAIISDIQSTLASSADQIESSPVRHRAIGGLVRSVLQRNYGGFLQPPGGPQMPATTGVIFCGMKDGVPFIGEVEPNGLCAELERDWHTIGSGAGFAHVAGSMMEHYGLSGRNVNQGTLLVYRALSVVIATSSFGVGGPLQIWQVTGAGSRKLEDQEMQTLEGQLGLLKEMEQDALNNVTGEGSGPEEPLPPEVPEAK